jgi:hypothetical protein
MMVLVLDGFQLSLITKGTISQVEGFCRHERNSRRHVSLHLDFFLNVTWIMAIVTWGRTMMARFQSSPGHCRYLVSFLLVWHGSAMERERYIYLYPLIIFLYRFLALLVVLDTCGNPTHQKLTTLWSAKPGSWWLLFHIQIGRDCIVTYCILWKK